MGVSYNAYLVAGEKIALIDTVEESFGSRLEANIREAIGERKIDYLVVNHMEPDHSSSIAALRRIYPDIEIVGNAKTLQMIEGFYGIAGGTVEVKEGDVLDLGGLTLAIVLPVGTLLLTGGAFIMILSYTIRRMPYTIRSSSAILRNISPSIEEASINLGASDFKTFFKVTVPMMMSGVISGAILSWIMIITELSTSIILYTSKTKTMTLEIYSQIIRGNDGVASAISAIQTFSTIIALAVFFKVSGKKEITM